MAMKDLFKRVKKTVQKSQRSQELIKWQKKLETAKGGQNIALMDKREYLVFGDRVVDKNVNASTTPSKKANNIYNIIYEFVESQVNNQIPMPSVKTKREGFEYLAQAIEDSISSDMMESDIDSINDMNERITPVQGYSIVEIGWDPDFKHHLYKGEIKLCGRHPKQLIPQPKVYNLQKMDYFFILSDVSKEYVKRRYDKDLDNEEEQYPENTRLFGSELQTQGSPNETLSAGETEDEPLTECVCWYKDEDGDICKYVWINDTDLEDLPKFFYRRMNGEVKDVEILDHDVMGPNGPIAMAGEEVPYFIPTKYPVSVRINVPKNFTFGGQSDVDIIRDQQDSIKRVVHKMEEKLVKGGTIIKALDDHTTFKITDEIYQIIRGSQQQLSAISTQDLTADISRDIQFVQEQYRMAQSMLGITNSYQGKEDPTATSGKAKQIQVQQASGRMQSKMFNKYVHYKEIFEIIFQFKLAFYDELRPYLAEDTQGNQTYGEFDKYQFLQKDKTGRLYYNTDFIFGTDGSFGLPKDPMFMYQQAMSLFASQAIDVPQLWTILESLKFPQANKIKHQWQEKMDQQQIIEQLQQVIEQLQNELGQAQAGAEQMSAELQSSQQNNAQAEAQTIQEFNAGRKQEQDMMVSEDQRQHQKDMDIAKLALEQQKIASQGAGTF